MKHIDLKQFDEITPGTWKTHGVRTRDGSRDITSTDDNGQCTVIGQAFKIVGHERDRGANALAIAAIPALIAELREARAREAMLRSTIERWRDEALSEAATDINPLCYNRLEGIILTCNDVLDLLNKGDETDETH